MMTEGPPTPTSSSGVLLLGETEYVTVLESMVPTYSIPATVECSTESTKKAPLEAPDLPLKPVKVDNWGIYLLQRLHSFYEKGEHTDLVLRFPAHSDLIPIHRLVFEAATDWLVPHQTQVARGIIDMPHNFTPDVVRPVVNFMYTGRLTTGNASYDRIKETAELLRMSVLIKLIDDAKTRTNERPPIKKNTSDPVRQIKRIKTIEKRFEDHKRRSRILALKERERILEEKNRLPGKKLPFWKKRTIPVNSSTVSINNSENTTTSTTTTTLPIQISNSNVHPELEKTLLNDLDHGKIPASSNTIIPNPQSEHNCSSSKDNNQKPMSQHQSQNSDGEIQSPQIPTIIYKRKITSESDMNQRKGPDSQQAVLFDHVRETGSKKQTKSSTNSLAENPNNEDNVKTPNDIDESMKELLEEQRKRLTLRQENSDNEEDDHHNQDDYVGGDDEYYLGEMIEEDSNKQSSIVSSSELPKFVAKKSLPVSESVPVAPSKVVRFSLTPSSNSSFNYKTQNTIFDEVKSNTNMESHSLDLPPPPSSQSLSQPNTMPPPDSPKKDSKPSSKSDTVIKVYSDSGDKKQVISEVLKKNPGLLKNHRQVKLKIMTKDSDNKQSVQCVTLRASESSVNIPSVIKNTPDKRLTEKRIRIMNNLNGDYKHSPKVMYTGRRGRPKQIKEGEFDPHEQVRQEIDQRLSRNGFYETKGKQDPKTKVSGQIQHITTQAFQPVQTLENTPIELSSSNIATKPSTEAEAMSKVASGIATSIYLVPPDFVEGSATSNGGSNFMGASHSFPISMNEDVIISKNDLSSSNLSKKNPNPNLTEERSTDLDKVSALVLEWDEEDEEEEQKLIKKTLK
uniref:BTB domain-containing protein n=1 Tax=Lepeophtheirus salmonis TaxID=72036 RepID=A0A0K2SVP8_LEPSM